MTDQNNNDITRELREAERLEAGLTGFFASLQPPAGAAERLLARFEHGEFHESQLTLDDGPYSFELAAHAQEQETAGSDLLAAGLEEEITDEDELDPETD